MSFPYDEGFAAAEEEKEMTDCPYPYDTKEAEEWILGFDDAKDKQLNGFT